MPIRIVVLDGYCLNPGDLSWDRLRTFGEVEIYDRTPVEKIVERATRASLLLTNKTPLSGEVLAQLPNLRYIGVLATGYNIVEMEAARRQKIIVTNIPTYGTASVAQMVFALLLELTNHVALHGEAVRAGEWQSSPDWCFWKSPLIELAGKTMGIVGFGRIGRQTASIAHAFGMKIIAADVNQTAAPQYQGFRWAALEELLRESDVVSLHSPLLPDTAGMINARRLGLMRSTAFLINTSRGHLVVDQDLANALNNEKIAGAGIDVLSIEPPSSGNPLFTARNCIVTPHISWATHEARSRLLDEAIENIACFLADNPRNLV